MDCHSVNVYKEEEILAPFLYTTHPYFLGIRSYSMFTLWNEKILQVYCLDSVSSGHAALYVSSPVSLVVDNSSMNVLRTRTVSYTHLTLPTTPYV